MIELHLLGGANDGKTRLVLFGSVSISPNSIVSEGCYISEESSGHYYHVKETHDEVVAKFKAEADRERLDGFVKAALTGLLANANPLNLMHTSGEYVLWVAQQTIAAIDGEGEKHA